MINFLLVGIGGFIGSCIRYLFVQIPVWGNIEFPVSTLLINFIGSFLIGIISFMSPSSPLNLFFKFGICGGFTTFSTFSLETFNMIESGKIFPAVSYSLASLVLCLIGVFLGKLVSRILLCI